MDELKQIQEEVRSSHSLKELRGYFERVQELRRIHSGNFDVQIQVAEAQEQIIERARDLRSRSGTPFGDEDMFEPSRAPQRSPAGTAPARAEEPQEAIANAEPGEKSWRRATLIALGLTGIICIVFFSLIQAARRINLPPAADSTAPKAADQSKAPVAGAKANEPAVPLVPTLRLYTDLIPGTVSIDDGEPQDLKDGELVLDHLEAGRHSIKVAGRSGTAEFSFDVGDNSAPQAVAPLAASDALAVLVSQQDGKGHLWTSVQQPNVWLDGKPLGQAGPDGLALTDMSTSDHELQIGQGSNDRQRFVMTYTPSPVLTAYVKSVSSLGIVTLKTKQDGVSIFIEDKLYRRKTENGQIRLPLKVGKYAIRVHKDGFVDPAPQMVEVKKGEEAELVFNLNPAVNLAYLDVRGASPGAALSIDKASVGTVGADGHIAVDKVTPGEHTIELRAEGFLPKKFQRVFQAGSTVSLSGPDTALQKVPAENPPAEQPAAAAAPAEDTASEKSAAPVAIPGEQVRRGGGFVHYASPKTAGHYSFEAHSKIGGFLKHDKLQWYAGYENSENYVMFSLDGKRAKIRKVVDGKAVEVNRIPFNTSTDQWVQVDLMVKADSMTARIRTPGGSWKELGTVSSSGNDFTQGKMGFYLPGNDEIAVANFRFGN